MMLISRQAELMADEGALRQCLLLLRSPGDFPNGVEGSGKRVAEQSTGRPAHRTGVELVCRGVGYFGWNSRFNCRLS